MFGQLSGVMGGGEQTDGRTCAAHPVAIAVVVAVVVAGATVSVVTVVTDAGTAVLSLLLFVSAPAVTSTAGTVFVVVFDVATVVVAVLLLFLLPMLRRCFSPCRFNSFDAVISTTLPVAISSNGMLRGCTDVVEFTPSRDLV